MATKSAFRVAIVGSGIVGTVFAHALLERGISVQIYEQSSDVRTTGGGINATEVGVRALKRCGQPCYDAYAENAQRHHRDRPELVFTITDGREGFEVICEKEYGSMPRFKFLDSLVRRLPPGMVHFGRRVKALQQESRGEITLEFEDGSTETADVVIGCDGVNSKIRKFVVGDGFEASFEHTVMCKGLVAIKDVEKIIGQDLARGAVLGTGKGDGYVFYPVSEDTGNLGYYKAYPEPWPYFPQVTYKWNKKELLSDLESAGVQPQSRAMVDLFPTEEIDIWGMMHLEKDLPTYNKRRIAVMGDAAHASTPYLGSGAGQGYEDALICAELLQAVSRSNLDSQELLYSELERALTVYTEVRRVRSQNVVHSSQEAGMCLKGAKPLEDAAKEYERRCHEIWDVSIDEMVDDALRHFME